MVVSDLVFDIVVFGALLLALLLDNAFPFSPTLHGATLLLAVGTAAYFAAREMCAAMQRRGWWTQDSLATTVALSTTGFIYYFARNDSDLALLGLSVSLMMAALMTMISLLAAASAAWAEPSVRPVLGLVATFAGALSLGALSGLLIVVLSSDVPLPLKAVVLGVGAVLWKLREKLRPPARNTATPALPTAGEFTATGASAVGTAASVAAQTAAITVGGELLAGAVDATIPARQAPEMQPITHWVMPQRGTLLDRFLPVLLLGALFFLAFRANGPAVLLPSGPPASASNQNRQTDKAPADNSNASPDASSNAPNTPAPDAP